MSVSLLDIKAIIDGLRHQVDQTKKHAAFAAANHLRRMTALDEQRMAATLVNHGNYGSNFQRLAESQSENDAKEIQEIYSREASLAAAAAERAQNDLATFQRIMTEAGHGNLFLGAANDVSETADGDGDGDGELGGSHTWSIVSLPQDAAGGETKGNDSHQSFAPPQYEAVLGKINYNMAGWVRIIRASDMCFQWVRMDKGGGVPTDGIERFDPDKSAYVRRLEFRPGRNPQLRDGILTLVAANQALVASSVKDVNNQKLVSCGDIADARSLPFAAKSKWFKAKCDLLRCEFTKGHMRINVRRHRLLEDSVSAIMSLSRQDMRKDWRFEFIGETPGDDRALAREWFQLVTVDIFDTDLGLWQSSKNQMYKEIYPGSKFVYDNHVIYYRFLGRVIGKALFDQQLVHSIMGQCIYKHILGWPVFFQDLALVDEDLFNSLTKLKEMAINGDDLSCLCLNFTTTTDIMGVREEVELVPGGADIEVTGDNLPEYLEATVNYRMLDRFRPQMTELLLGVVDVIPEPLLAVFDFQELEVLVGGLPVIDMKDWMTNTDYCGEFESCGPDHLVCGWFWEVVDEFDQEIKARLLQFVTGTSGLPIQGFAGLRGSDGQIRRFTVNGVGIKIHPYPRAQMGVNRIDLPMFNTKEELQEALKLALTMIATGFDN